MIPRVLESRIVQIKTWKKGIPKKSREATESQQKSFHLAILAWVEEYTLNACSFDQTSNHHPIKGIHWALLQAYQT